MRGKRRSFAFLLMLSYLGIAGSRIPAWAQTSLAEVVGEVRDPSGTVVPRAAVVLNNEATGVKTELTTNEVGVFSSSSILPGVYEVRATAPGFKTYVATHIELRTGQILRKDIVLELGAVSQQVEVVGQAGAAELQRDSGDVSSVLDFQTVQEIPSETRKVLELVALTPGVNLTGSGSTTNQTLAFFSIAGNPGTRGAT